MGGEFSEAPKVFDRAAVRAHRDRAARLPAEHDFLVHEAAERLLDRLDDVKRQFPRGLDLGCRSGFLGDALGGRGGVESILHADISWEMVRTLGSIPRSQDTPPVTCVVADEELLPFASASFDVILSNLSLHWTNDLPGALAQLNRALKPDGLFLATLFGGDTLWELRDSLLQAEAEVDGGASPRVSPFVDVRDAGDLPQSRSLHAVSGRCRLRYSELSRYLPVDDRSARHGRNQLNPRTPTDIHPAGSPVAGRGHLSGTARRPGRAVARHISDHHPHGMGA